MRVDRDNPVIVLEVILGGPYGELEVEMALDTGATYTMVPWDVARSWVMTRQYQEKESSS